MATDKALVQTQYDAAKAVYAGFGIDTEAVMKKMKDMSISLHCWQGDDVSGFEIGADGISGGGIMTTGNYPGRARNGEELRADLEKAFSLLPGKHRVNLHALYAETDGKVVDRDQLTVEHFRKWIDWAKKLGIGLDFNPSFFSHPKAAAGYTLSSKDESIRTFWVEHGKISRRIAAAIGKELGSPCVNNVWIPDGAKDLVADRLGYRAILKKSLDEVFAEKFDEKYLVDAIESKVFGIGSESFVVGSHEFYMGYALMNKKVLCLDMGHFHPTENVADKISSLLTFQDHLLLHVSRPVRWDSDHVVAFNDDLILLAQELKRADAYGKVYFALDFFDASINRITAWVTGARNALKAILFSQLEASELLKKVEEEGNLGDRLALMEEFKTLPYGAVWNKYCLDMGTPVAADWLSDVHQYEKDVQSKRV